VVVTNLFYFLQNAKAQIITVDSIIKKPISILNRELKMVFSKFVDTFTKVFAYRFVIRFENAIIEMKGALSAIGLRKDCSEMAWFLIFYYANLKQAHFERGNLKQANLERAGF
jgi:uncharacterized protein YjbI with pentapeptide repeats